MRWGRYAKHPLSRQGCSKGTTLTLLRVGFQGLHDNLQAIYKGLGLGDDEGLEGLGHTLFFCFFLLGFICSTHIQPRHMWLLKASQCTISTIRKDLEAALVYTHMLVALHMFTTALPPHQQDVACKVGS